MSKVYNLHGYHIDLASVSLVEPYTQFDLHGNKGKFNAHLKSGEVQHFNASLDEYNAFLSAWIEHIGEMIGIKQ